ncbi:MAG: hypothetical protein KDA94_01255 [Acidimicrobiales bacterium]|nr:hypothetical protein [Acidimicrobiales bacterium]
MPPDVAPDQPAMVAATERWFVRRGLPHLIADYRASEDIFTRSLPVLGLVFLLELLGAANLEWGWLANLAALAAAVTSVVALWALVNRSRGRRWSRLPDRVGAAELAVFLLVPPVLPLVFGGQVGSAAVSFVANVVLLAVVYLVTSYGLVPMTRWALGETKREIGTVLDLLGRALPLLLLFSVALFINTEVWQVAASLDGVLFWTAAGFFVVVGTAFLLVRLPGELKRLGDQLVGDALVEACEDTPMAPAARDLVDRGVAGPRPLSRRQQGNVLLVLLFSQAVQIVLVTVAIGAFFFAFGLVAIRPPVIDAWLGDIGTDVIARFELAGHEFELTRALVHVTGFLAVLSGFYFTVYVITDATYREEFLSEILDEVRQSLAVRNAYLALLSA